MAGKYAEFKVNVSTLVELEDYVITVITHLEFGPIKITIYYRYGSLYIKK
jgi:hypothetical protein